MDKETLSLIFSLVALYPILVYYLRWQFYTPKIFLRIGGEQGGEPIKIPRDGSVFFAVSTPSNRRAFISEIWVNFDSEKVDLWGTKGAEQHITTDEQFPTTILFTDKKAIKKQFPQANYFAYKTENPEFSVKFVVITKVDETELPFFFGIFSPMKNRVERIVKFKVVEGLAPTIQEIGLALLPYERLQVEGVQAQDAVWAATSQGTANVKITEIIDKR